MNINIKKLLIFIFIEFDFDIHNFVRAITFEMLLKQEYLKVFIYSIRKNKNTIKKGK